MNTTNLYPKSLKIRRAITIAVNRIHRLNFMGYLSSNEKQQRAGFKNYVDVILIQFKRCENIGDCLKADNKIVLLKNAEKYGHGLRLKKPLPPYEIDYMLKNQK